MAPTAIAVLPCAFAVVQSSNAKLNFPPRSAPYERNIAGPLQERHSRPES